MNRTFFWASVAAVSLISVGCGSGSGSYTPKPVEPVVVEKITNEDGKLLFPVKVGNKWTYDLESQQSVAGQVSKSNETLVFEIVGIKPSGTGIEVTMKSSISSDKSDTQTWLFDDRGLFQVTVSSKGTAYNPPQPTFLFPIQPGENFTWKGVGPTILGTNGNQSYKGTMYQPQLVDTKMGTMTGVGIEANGTFSESKVKDGKVKIVSYWAKNVGLIRYRQDSVFTTDKGVVVAGTNVLVLKEYSLKKD